MAKTVGCYKGVQETFPASFSKTHSYRLHNVE